MEQSTATRATNLQGDTYTLIAKLLAALRDAQSAFHTIANLGNYAKGSFNAILGGTLPLQTVSEISGGGSHITAELSNIADLEYEQITLLMDTIPSVLTE